MNAKPTPIHPPAGLAQHEAEARRRIVAGAAVLELIERFRR